jgi:hypothetical protein
MLTIKMSMEGTKPRLETRMGRPWRRIPRALNITQTPETGRSISAGRMAVAIICPMAMMPPAPPPNRRHSGLIRLRSKELPASLAWAGSEGGRGRKENGGGEGRRWRVVWVCVGGRSTAKRYWTDVGQPNSYPAACEEAKGE